MPFFLVFLLAIAAYAQGVSLEGMVNDPQGAAVAGASVFAVSRNRDVVQQRVTRDDGGFVFSDLPGGEYLLRVEAPGFATAVRRARTGDRVKVVLALAAVSEQITVTATRSAQTPTEVAHAAAVIDAGELESRQKDRLADAMREVAGVRVQQNSGPGSFTKLVFRGLRTTNTSVLLDGMPIRDAAGFRGDLASFFAELNPNNVSAIEVVRGAGSALYGSAATGGVINFVPREPSAATHADFGYEGGSLSQAVGRFRMAGTTGSRLGYSLGFIRTDVNAGIDGNDVWRNNNVSGLAQYQLRRNISLNGNVFLTHTPRVDLNETPFPIGPPGNEFGFETGQGPVTGFVSSLDDPDDRRESSILPASLRLDHRVAASYAWSVAYRAVVSRRNFPSGPRQDPRAAQLGIFESVADLNRFDGEDHLVETRHNFELGGLDRLSVGYAFERQASTQEFVAGDFRMAPVTDRQGSHAAFFHNQLTLLERRLQIGLSGRIQTFQVDNPESVPELRNLDTPNAKTGDAAVSYFVPRTRTKLRVHGGNSFREPSLSERFQILTISGERIRVGNPLIEPERSVSVDGGFDQYLWDGRVQVGVTYYYTRLQSLIQSRTLFRQTNVRGGLSRGVEIEALARPARFLSLRAAYTYTRSDFIPTVAVRRFDGSLAPARIARRVEGIPEHVYSASATARRGRWDGFLEVAGISNYDSPLFSPIRFEQILFRFDGYARTNLGIGYTRPVSENWQMRWYGRVENVFNPQHYEDGFPLPRAVGIVGVRFLR